MFVGVRTGVVVGRWRGWGEEVANWVKWMVLKRRHHSRQENIVLFTGKDLRMDGVLRKVW